MSIEIVSLLLLWVILIAVISYLAWFWKWSTDCKLLEAELSGHKMAREAQQKKYDNLYDAFLRVNQYNTALNKKLQESSKSYETVADGMYSMFLNWKSRKEISDYYNIPYSTTCFYIRTKKHEYLGDVKAETLF